MAECTSVHSFRQQCGYCEMDILSGIIWKCAECDLRFCRNCKTVHRLMESTPNHSITIMLNQAPLIKPIYESQNQIILPCLNHPNEEARLYCNKRHTLVCLTCIDIGKQGRNRNAVEMDVQDLVKIIADAKEQLDRNVTSLERIRQNKQCYSQGVATEGAGIKDQQKEKREANALVQEVQKMDIRELEMSSTEKLLEESVYGMKVYISICEDTARHGDTISKFERIRQIRSKYHPWKTILLPRVAFFRERKDASLINPNAVPFVAEGEMYSKTLSDESTSNESVPNMSIISSFIQVQSGDCYLFRKMAVRNDKVWVAGTADGSMAIWGSGGMGINSFISETKNYSQSKILRYPMLFDIAVSHSEKLLLTQFGRSSVKKISMDGDIEGEINLDFETLGLCITVDDDILVCVCPCSAGHQQKVLRVTLGGQIKQTIQHLENGEAFLKYPRYIAQNSNSDICILDDDFYFKDQRSELDRANSLVVVDGNGKQLRFRYKGLSKLCRFEGICCDNLGCILLNEIHQIHRLDKDGHLMQIIHRSEIGIGGIKALYADKSGRLFVCDEDNVIILKYLA